MANLKVSELVLKELNKYFEGFTNENGDEVGIYDYLIKEALDYEFIINSDFSFKAVKIFIGLGGPTIWLDTSDNSINVAYASDFEKLYFFSDLGDAINEYYEDTYNYNR